MDRFDVIIAGSRGFNDYALLTQRCDRLFSQHRPTAIISGAARGADTLGERYAKERGIPVKQFPAQWDRYGKRAGYLAALLPRILRQYRTKIAVEREI